MNYKQSTVPGTVYQRCNKLEIGNPKDAGPYAIFKEERIITIGEEVISKPVGDMIVPILMDEIFTVRDPNTGEPTGQVMSQGELYVLLYSVYMHHAIKRDEKQALLEQQQAAQ